MSFKTFMLEKEMNTQQSNMARINQLNAYIRYKTQVMMNSNNPEQKKRLQDQIMAARNKIKNINKGGY
jgi:hypothetical protein